MNRAEIHSLYKSYRLARIGFRSLFRKRSQDSFALENLSWSLAAGEVTGLLGKNGSGKSTLLRMLARITRPTSGKLQTKGRVVCVLGGDGALHPDFLVEEALGFQASLCLMDRRDLKGLHEEILLFAGLSGRAKSTIKTLSLGERARLLIAVTLYSDWDLLLLDEAFSNLDIEFRWKCEQKIRSRTRQGASALLVSHDWEWISRFCDRALVLEHGKKIDEGKAPEVILRQLERLSVLSEMRVIESGTREQGEFLSLINHPEKEGPSHSV